MIPYTYLSPIGSYSFIDHFIISKNTQWSEINQVNIVTTEREKKEIDRLTDRRTYAGTSGWTVSGCKGVQYSDPNRSFTYLKNNPISLRNSYPKFVLGNSLPVSITQCVKM